MTITIDCRMIDSSGVGVYLRGCLPLFLQSGHDFLLLGNTVQLRPFALNSNVKIAACDIKSFSLKELFFFPQNTVRQINETDIFYSPFFNIPCGIKIPVYTTIHDLIFSDMPYLASRAGLAARMWFYRRAYKKSRALFTVSDFSKSRITHHLGKTKPVIITYSAARNIFSEYRSKTPCITKNKSIVFAGNIKKHKGLDCLLDAFTLAKNEGLNHKLIIIGSSDNFRTVDNAVFQKIESLGAEFVLFTGYVSDEQLMEHVSAAALLVQPSLYEGFCLPPLEALILGTNALISDIPVLREIYSGFPVTFFEKGNATDLKSKMLEVLSCNKPAPVLPADLASKYSFEKTASIIIENLTKGTVL